MMPNRTLTVVPGSKPEPFTVTVLPTMPLVGFKVISWATVKVVEALSPWLSVAVRVWMPLDNAGMVNRVAKPP